MLQVCFLAAIAAAVRLSMFLFVWLFVCLFIFWINYTSLRSFWMPQSVLCSSFPMSFLLLTHPHLFHPVFAALAVSAKNKALFLLKFSSLSRRKEPEKVRVLRLSVRLQCGISFRVHGLFSMFLVTCLHSFFHFQDELCASMHAHCQAQRTEFWVWETITSIYKIKYTMRCSRVKTCHENHDQKWPATGWYISTVHAAHAQVMLQQIWTAM